MKAIKLWRFLACNQKRKGVELPGFSKSCEVAHGCDASLNFPHSLVAVNGERVCGIERRRAHK